MKRRVFLKDTIISAAGAFVAPTIVPSSVLGKNAPSNKIHVGQIGLGRIAASMDLPGIMKRDVARVIACSDLDGHRLTAGKAKIDQFYAEKTGKSDYVNAKMFEDYRELLARKDIDAVVISTPDHWHMQIAIEAALAGKDVFCQKPTSLTIAEGRLFADIAKKKGTVVQICTQHRTFSYNRIACELVRNGRIGKLHTVSINIGGESPGPVAEKMPVPKTFNYDKWLGSTPETFYTEIGVHPQTGYGRPGWMKRHQFGAGGITNTGQHFIDVAAWAMDTEYTGPVSIEAVGKYPRAGIFDVPSDFLVKAVYENDLTLYMSSLYPGLIKYEGTEGWITTKPFEASDPAILNSVIKENEIHLLQTDSMHGNWLDCIQTRKPTLVPAEVAHRSCSVALLSDISMELSRKLYWNPEKEQFINDPEANAMLSRPQRKPYGTNYIKV
ncbi:MAG TPA: Gfo/Idh/MocA family oxidoreductase [Flavitalea sp.]|nr:Gfo/Idh/MocA family oxidoreductase [Flavitalea sp.]